MKKVWEKPKLVLLCRGREEEVLLANCKMSGSGAANSTAAGGCRKVTGCTECNNIVVS